MTNKEDKNDARRPVPHTNARPPAACTAISFKSRRLGALKQSHLESIFPSPFSAEGYDLMLLSVPHFLHRMRIILRTSFLSSSQPNSGESLKKLRCLIVSARNSSAWPAVRLYMIELPCGCETAITAMMMAMPSVLPERRGNRMATVSLSSSMA